MGATRDENLFGIGPSNERKISNCGANKSEGKPIVIDVQMQSESALLVLQKTATV